MDLLEVMFLDEIKSCEYNLWDEQETKEHINNCIKIADEYALYFAKWIDEKTQKRVGQDLYWYNGNLKNMEQLLKIYKTEITL